MTLTEGLGSHSVERAGAYPPRRVGSFLLDPLPIGRVIFRRIDYLKTGKIDVASMHAWYDWTVGWVKKSNCIAGGERATVLESFPG